MANQPDVLEKGAGPQERVGRVCLPDEVDVLSVGRQRVPKDDDGTDGCGGQGERERGGGGSDGRAEGKGLRI